MLGKTIRGSDFDNIFTEVPHTEKLGLINPEQLRLFHLNVMNNRFVSDDLQSFIRKNVGRYVFSRAKLEQFRTNGDLESIGLEAMTIMTNNGTPGQKDTGNALGEILLYSFLEQILDAPKIMSKVELVTNANSHSSKHGMLRWYAVILIQWIQGTGLSHIMNKAIEFKQNNPDSGVQVNGKQERYNDSREHRNVVIADTLEVIENVILFSISNYFLRFSNEYKRLHNLETFQNDWYEYVEYGTTNPLTILLQRSGFSRETSTYIRQHKSEYVVITQSGNIKLRRSLLRSRNIGVARESADIQYNVPEIFVD